jgi:hypothetical protein
MKKKTKKPAAPASDAAAPASAPADLAAEDG